MTISRSTHLKTSLSHSELIALHPCDVVEDDRRTTHYIKGTKSIIDVYPISAQYEWQNIFGVEYNVMVSVDIDPETSPETMRILDQVTGPFIKQVGGEGWISHIDIPRVHWNESGIRVDREAPEGIVRSIENAGLEYEIADLRAEYDAT